MKEISPCAELRGRNSGYFPLSQKEAERIRRFLSFREDCDAISVLDPCAGGGAAMATITSGAKTLTYGIELDAFRAEEARLVLGHVIQGNCFDVHSAVESFSLLFENPPYDFEVGENRNGRMEFLFLEHTYRWLKPGAFWRLWSRATDYRPAPKSWPSTFGTKRSTASANPNRSATSRSSCSACAERGANAIS